MATEKFSLSVQKTLGLKLSDRELIRLYDKYGAKGQLREFNPLTQEKFRFHILSKYNFHIFLLTHNSTVQSKSY
jgi:hypothetical protein